MKKAVLLFIVLLIAPVLFAQQKYALVIGNANYAGISKLNNPVNDANEMETALRNLGFTVEKVLNGNLDQMENAVQNLKRRLGASRNSYGFFFYAGHGVQSGGDNYLIPVDANIQSESQLRQRAVSVQAMLDDLEGAGNILNMIVLDACRDNPFGWSRSGSRGLTVVSRAPTGSIIMYATSANSTADDGTGQNGLFTSQLLNSLRTPGLSVREMFDNTGSNVRRVSNERQIPEISVRFFDTVYLGSRPLPNPSEATAKDYYDRGESYYDQGEYELAIAEFTHAIRLNYGWMAYFYRASTYSTLKNFDRAIADYTQAITLNPNLSQLYFGRGLAYANKAMDAIITSRPVNKGDVDQAIANFTQAITLNSKYADSYYWRGLMYNQDFFGIKDYNRAIRDFEAALQINPNYPEAREYLEEARRAARR